MREVAFVTMEKKSIKKSVKKDFLTPSRSIYVLEKKSGENITRHALSKLFSGILPLLHKIDGVDKISNISNSSITGNDGSKTEFSWCNYTHSSNPSWASSDSGLLDSENHLILFSGHLKFLFVYLSHKSGWPIKFLDRPNNSVSQVFSEYEFVDQRYIIGALRKGRLKTLWLKGLHTPVDYKEKSKVMGGDDLELALNPVVDYTFTSSAIVLETSKGSLGISSGIIKIWQGGQISSFASFVEFVDWVGNSLHKYSEEPKSLPILARRVNHQIEDLTVEIVSINLTTLNEANAVEDFLCHDFEIISQESVIKKNTQYLLIKLKATSDQSKQIGVFSIEICNSKKDTYKINTSKIVGFETDEGKYFLQKIKDQKIHFNLHCQSNIVLSEGYIFSIDLNETFFDHIVWQQIDHSITITKERNDNNDGLHFWIDTNFPKFGDNDYRFELDLSDGFLMKDDGSGEMQYT